jgi:hypothetical protein
MLQMMSELIVLENGYIQIYMAYKPIYNLYSKLRSKIEYIRDTVTLI